MSYLSHMGKSSCLHSTISWNTKEWGDLLPVDAPGAFR